MGTFRLPSTFQKKQDWQGLPRLLGSEYLLPAGSVRSLKEQSMVAGPPFKDEALASPRAMPCIPQDGIKVKSNGRISLQDSNDWHGLPGLPDREHQLSARSQKEQSMVAGPLFKD